MCLKWLQWDSITCYGRGPIIFHRRSRDCSYDVLVFTGRVIDRGKLFQSSRSSPYASISSKLCVNILTSCVVIPHGLIAVHKNDWEWVYEPFLRLGYLSKFSFANLMVISSAREDGNGDTRKQSDRMQHQRHVLWTNQLNFQMPGLGMYGNAEYFFNPLLVEYLLGFFNLQHRVLYCHIFFLSGNCVAWVFQFMRTYYTSDRKIYFPVLKVLNSEGAILWDVSILQVIKEIEYVIAQRMLDQGMARDISFLTQMGLVREGIVTPITNSSQNLLDITSMRVGWLFYMCARSEKYLCDSLVLARTLFDRGKLFESISR
ncbi:uncharacterized protein LOC113309515 [Papaver somniferum]|uniref:uncharacterized protein LOC113309515 n=1 Tax=Papaver somniferum TaxID=3469 RepID=UPI000E6FC0AA|nr:uncharacterized protein LOC113309515 [Papaver somniferum]